jgi:hypothetical protein
MLTAAAFPSIGRSRGQESDARKPRRQRRNSGASGSNVDPGAGPTPFGSIDTELARRGSNFGLPIALHLARALGGAVGIESVR